MKPLRVLVLLVIFSSIYILSADEEQPGNKRVLEKVDVTNALITIRVYDKKKPVKGLKKSDFRIIENGEKKQINQCYMKRKQFRLEEEHGNPEGNRKPADSPRLYVLIFNISDYRLNINEGIDYFFDRVLRPKDRLMLMTNRFFLSDHLVTDPQAEKKRVKKVIYLEMVRAKSNINEIEKTLQSYIDDYRDFLIVRNIRDDNEFQDSSGRSIGGSTQTRNNPDNPDRMEREAISLFVSKYTNFVKETKKSFLHIPLRQYIGLAAYLKEQELEKWVLNFFQIPRFPQPDLNSDFMAKIRACGYSMDVLTAIMLPEEAEENSIARLFVNTGATFHTLLMKYEGELFTDSLRNYLSYQPISSDSEAILRKISRMTGGKVIRSNKIFDLYNKISTREDIYYVLAYKTDTPGTGNRQKISVSIKNKTYRVVFDNRKRSGTFRRAQNKILRSDKEKIQQIRLKNVIYRQGILKILVEQYKIDSTLKPYTGHVQVRLQFLNSNAKVVLDKEKTIKTPEPALYMAIKLSELGKGQFDVVILVKDLVTGMQDLAIQEVTIR